MRRAAHQLLDHPLVHEDPLALAILGETQAAAIRADPRRFEDSVVAPFLRAFLAVRSRVAEDALAEAVAAGIRQYVILGAGLDTFAYRSPYTALQVFEVDYPATQEWKRRRLEDVRIVVPKEVRFVSVDFSKEQLSTALCKAGLRAEEPTLFSWLGVTQYLEPADVLATLTAIAGFGANGGGVIFDYSIPQALLAPQQKAAFERLATRVASAGEAFRASFEPGALAEAMRAMGYLQIREMGPDELNARFFSNRADGLRVGGSGHIMVALG
jgi:methyltransferase (TIGR00027 family)